MNRWVSRLIPTAALLGLALSLVSAQETAQWTIIYYMALDNNLEAEGFGDLREMSYAGSSDDVNIVVQYDRSQAYDDTQGDWSTTRRFYVERAQPQVYSVEQIAAELAPTLNDGSTTDDDIASQIVALSQDDPQEYQSLIASYGLSADAPFSQEALEDIGEANMGDAQTLADFIGFSIENYPAEHYMLVISDHGGGWHSIGPDEDSGNDMLELPEIDEALTIVRDSYGLEKFDIIGFDACLMATVEAAAMLEPHADYMLASQEVIPGEGWEYNLTFNALRDRPEMDAFELGTVIVDNYMEYYAGPGNQKKVGLSLADLSQVPALTEALATFATAAEGDTAAILSALAITRNNTQPFGTSAGDAGEYFSSIDLRGFMELLSAQPAIDEAIFSATQEVVAAYDRVVPYSLADDRLPGATGMAIYLPLTAEIYDFANGDSSYADVIPASMEVWNDFLLNFHRVAGETVTGEDLMISVDNVITVSGTASVEDMPTVLFSTDGVGVVDLSYAVLMTADNGLRQIVDASNIAIYSTLPEGQSVIEYPDGASNLNFSWPAELPVLTDGTNETYVVVQTNNTADNQGLVAGTLVAYGDTLEANLVFDLTTRELLSVLAFQDNGEGYAAPFDVSPEAGWTFTPSNIYVTDDGETTSEPSDVTLVFGRTPVTYAYQPAPSNTYEFFMTITDLAGNSENASTSFAVDNDAIRGDLRGFTDSERGLYFPFPYTWLDSETVIEESGDESYVLRTAAADLSNAIYVNFIEADSADAVLSEVQSRLDNVGATVSSETPVAFEDGDGYRLDYTYSDDNGARSGVMFALYSALSNQGYSVDVDFEAGSEQELSAVAATIEENVRVFDPNSDGG